jgi:holo-[acyl-carrier protein] synthase
VIYGVGTDLCDVRRVAATYGRRGERFAERVLGPDELQVFHARRARSAERGLRFLATRFSAKEAFSKAVGLGIRTPMAWRDCQILNEPGGRPYLRLSGALSAWFEARALVAHVSLSDESEYASSFVVVESLGATVPPTAGPAGYPP